MEPARIAQHFTEKSVINAAPYGNGRIHQTYLVTLGTGEQFILQKLHSVFKSEVLFDIEKVTHHLAAKGIKTQRLIPTLHGDYGYTHNGACWRALAFIPGKTFETGITPSQAEDAAALIGAFHAALSDFNYEYRHILPGFHDTPRIMEHLKKTLADNLGTKKYDSLAPLAEEILSEYEKSKGALTALPLRHVHGDLKLDNILFDEGGRSAIALLDLDTLGKRSVPIELGDAARSWCNRASEDAEDPEFSMEIFESMMRGYFKNASFLTKAEKTAIPTGVATIILELSARFVTDAFEESYFTLDVSRYKSSYEQNAAKAHTQMKLYRDFIAKKDAAQRIVGS